VLFGGDRGAGRRGGRLDFPLCISQRRGTRGGTRLAFLSSVRGGKLRPYPDSARARSGQPADHLSISSESATVRLGEPRPALEIELWEIDLWRNEREGENEKFGGDLVPLRAPLRCFSRFARIVARGGFVPAAYFPLFNPLFLRRRGKSAVRSGKRDSGLY